MIKEIANKIKPNDLNHHLYWPYNISVKDAKYPTVPKPNNSKIIGDKQHKDANKTGKPVIFRISFSLTIISF
jgi:hypothetical protein